MNLPNNEEFKTDISQLCEQQCLSGYHTKSYVRESVKSKMVQAQERCDIDPNSIFEYIKSEKTKAFDEMSKIQTLNLSQGKYYIKNRSNAYILYKEYAKALVEFEKELNANTSIDKKEPQQSEMKSDDTSHQRQIDVEKLKAYFINSFKGAGQNQCDYFNPMIEELNRERTGLAFRQISLMIFESNKTTSILPRTFEAWYREFCECVPCKVVKTAKKRLKPFPENLIKTFYYLV
jgi:hypothetical protein